MDNIYSSEFESPLGLLQIFSNESHITRISFNLSTSIENSHSSDLIERCKNQLDEYFKGKRKVFQLPIEADGSDFQKKVWDEVSKIDYGKTSTYNLIAKLLGGETYNRAVGLSNGANPLPIIIPCHRVIGSNGKLTGYAGGIEKKRWLLLHEMKNSNPSDLQKLF